MTFHQLMCEHDRIDMLTHGLEALCESDRPDIDRVLRTRADLKDALEHHLGHEDEAIYTKLMSARGEPAEAVRDFTSSFVDLRQDWGDYLEDWDAECLAIDWENFCRDTRALMGRVRDRTQRETGLIYPLALQSGIIRLREAVH